MVPVKKRQLSTMEKFNKLRDNLRGEAEIWAETMLFYMQEYRSLCTPTVIANEISHAVHDIAWEYARDLEADWAEEEVEERGE